MSQKKESFAVETDLFEHQKIQPHFINPCCFGEDFASWLRAKVDRAEFHFGETIQEDYGWGFWVTAGKERFWIAISYVGDEPQEGPAQWVLSVDYDPGLNLIKRLFHKPDYKLLMDLRFKVRQALESEPRIKFVSMPDYG
jgi:hypothetical protein